MAEDTTEDSSATLEAVEYTIGDIKLIKDIRDSLDHPEPMEVTKAVIKDSLGHPGVLEVTRVSSVLRETMVVVSVALRRFNTTTRSSTLVLST